MKVNADVAGNNIGGSNMRVNDLASPTPSPTPPSQIQEIDPAATLPSSANRALADTTLTNLAAAGGRLSSRSSLALLNEWGNVTNSFPDYAHLVTVLSRDDDTTSRGWKRLNLNALVAAAPDNAAKVAVASRIANWIRDAWVSSTPIANLQDYQMFGDDWLRKQIAANIVDYIDADNIPTDMGDIVPAGFTIAVPVIGLERIPQLVAVEILYEASDSTCPTPPVAGTYSATLKLKLQFRFLNLFESALDLSDYVGRIEIQGVPVVSKNGNTVFDVESQVFTVNLADLKPATGTGTCDTAGACSVPQGVDGTSDSGAKTVRTDWLLTQPVTFNVVGNDAKPRFLAGKITAKIFGKTGERLDDTAIVTNLTATGYNNSSGSSTKDFLTDANPTTGALDVASINVAYGYGGAVQSGDPRYRGRLVNDRWRNLDRTDATTPPTTNRIAQFIDKAELLSRTASVDWYDYAGDRPLAFIRNGPLLNIGELGNVSACEYPWRTLYLQYPERLANTTQTGPVTEVPDRRSQSVDYTILDLFRTSDTQPRAGAININTQQTFGTQRRALSPLFLGIPVGAQNVVQAGVDRIDNDPGSPLASSISNRRVAPAPTPYPDNNPVRPFFQIGELSSVLSRLVNKSLGGSGTTGSPGRSTVSYGLLRTSATTASETPVNANIQRDMQVEQLFREISNSITTRGNVFRVLYVGQSLKNGITLAEYLGEALVERQAIFAPEGSNPDALKTADSNYKVLANRVITE